MLTRLASARLAGSVRVLLRCVSPVDCRVRLSLRALGRITCRGVPRMANQSLGGSVASLPPARRHAVVVPLHRHDLRRLACHQRAQVRITAAKAGRRLGSRTFAVRVGPRFRARYRTRIRKNY